MQKYVSLGEIGTYPWRADLQKLLGQVGELSTSVNDFQGAGMDDGGVVLGVVVQKGQEN